MSGPLYLGFLVEQWSEESLDDVMRALPAAIRKGLGDSKPECYDLHVHAHEGSAWLHIDDACSAYSGGGDGPVIAAAIAKAAGSPTWWYEYNSTSSFYVGAARVTEDGRSGRTIEVTEETEVPPDLEAEPDFDFERFAQDRVSAAVLQRVRWDQEHLRGGHDLGPALLLHVTGEEHPLAPFFSPEASDDDDDDDDDSDDSDDSGSEPEPPRKQAVKKPPPAERNPAAVKADKALDRLEADALRVARTLEGLVSLLEEERPDLDRYLARARDDRLAAAFEPVLETLRTLAETVARTRLDDIALPLPPQLIRQLEHQKTAKGAPKTREHLVARLKAALDGVARDNIRGLERAVRTGLPGQKEALIVAGQLKLIRLVLHLAQLALIEGEDILIALEQRR